MTDNPRGGLLRLHVTAFGVLSLPDTPFDFARDRITLILGENETGKTTLAEALYASLYGVEHRESVRYTSLPHASRWRPVGNPTGRFGAQLHAFHNDREIVATWDFDSRTLKVTEALTGKDLTDEFRVGRNEYDFGEQLTGLTEDEFRKVCFIGQGAVSDAKSVRGISALVQRFAATAPGEGSTAAEAIDVLETAIREYPGTTGKGNILLATEIDRLSSQRDEAVEQLRQLDEQRATVAQDEARYEELRAQERKLQQEIDLARHLQRKAELSETRAQLAAAAKAASDLADMERERDGLAHLADFPDRESDRLAELQGRLKADGERMARLKEALERDLRPALDRRDDDLEAIGAFRDSTKDDQKVLVRLLAIAQKLQPRMAGLRQEMTDEEAQLAAVGIKAAELPGLRKRLAPLSEADLAEAVAYPTARAKAGERLNAATEGLNRAHELLAGVRRIRQRSKGISLAIMLASLAILSVLAGGLATGVFPPWATWLGIGVSVIGLTLGLAHWLMAGKERVQEYEEALREVQKWGEDAVAVRGELRRLEESAMRLAQACDFKSSDQLAEAAARLREVERKCARRLSLQDQWDRAQQELAGVQSEARALAERFHQPLIESELAAGLRQLLENVERACQLREKLDEQIKKVAQEESRAAELSGQIDHTAEAIRAILRSAKIEAADLPQGVERFGALRKQFARYRRLVDELIPDQTTRLASLGSPAALKSELAKLEQRVAEEVARRQEWLQAAPNQPSKEYAEEAQVLADQLRTVSEDRHNLGTSLSASLAHWQETAPRLADERDKLNDKLSKALRHQKALELALQELRDVAGRVHAEWAAELNERANRLLSSFVPSLCQLRFEEDLSFHVLRRSDGMEVAETPSGPALSMGQKDQLYLAVRLGIAGFVAGRSSGLPIILDDPFVNFDDARFAKAMRFLADEAPRQHQIILFSCHRERFAWLKRQDLGWFEAHIFERALP